MCLENQYSSFKAHPALNVRTIWYSRAKKKSKEETANQYDDVAFAGEKQTT